MDASTFDFNDLFTGNSLPTEEVTIFVNEALAYEIAVKEEEISRDPENEKLEKDLTDLKKRAESSKFTFKVTGLLKSDLMSLVEDVQEKFPQEFTALGRPKPNAKADDYFGDCRWAAQIVEIRAANGGVKEGVDINEAHELRYKLPAFAADAIEEALQGLMDKTRAGFELVAKETDFLSKR